MPNLTVKQVNILAKGLHSKTSDGNGLSFVVPKRGEPYWSLRYTFNEKRREKSLGKFGQLTLAEARGEAEKVRALIRDGIDPLSIGSVESLEGMTFDQLFKDMYQSKLLKRNKHPDIPKSKYENNVSSHIGHLKVEQVTAIHVRNILDSITNSGRRTVSNDVLGLLKQLFKHAIQLGITSNNPASAFSCIDAGGVEKPRRRVLSIEEVEHAFSVFRKHSDSFTRDNYLVCCLLITLGVRKSELIQAPWKEFDLANSVWHLPEKRTKTESDISIPLPPKVVCWLEELKIRSYGSEYVFPARRKSKVPYMGKDTVNSAVNSLFGIDKSKRVPPPNRMGHLEHFTIHDFRRTFRTIAGQLGFRQDALERCLNHKIGNMPEVYDQGDYFNERREVHEAVCSALKEALDS
ncbi:site-specific integrase [Pseudoalteromonas sp. Cnat2-41]|uniref:tyrosine-type recombinase/integrase n=1 Tax=unclassified Pseudoalteromonas TaxID=194690 RepID=UPI001EF8585B|nr:MULTISPECIES: site-specific integrase [unclassified Pseudoalteromonas]MCF2862911.1 site-specific integrase [Pseudoalteromonas sp. CNAT2-18]MCG7558637.1 site-specific integrase [Pseudoalteromonas sp. CNAT2-18.1]